MSKSNLAVKKIKTIEQIEKQEQTIKIIKNVFLYSVIVIGAIFMIIPFYWMINTSFKSLRESELIPPTFFPKDLMPFKWWRANYVTSVNAINYFTLLKNTITVGVLTTAGTLFTTILAAYAFARLKFKGRELLFILMLSTMMIPGEMMTISNYITVVKLGWLNSYWALTVPFMTSTFYVFFLRQTIKQIPEQLYQAAKVDGYSDFKYLTRVIIPIAKPTIITITILGLIGSWNAYVWPNLVITNKNLNLISVGLRQSFANELGRVEQNLQMAASSVVIIPLLVVFLLLKKYIIKGVSRSGIKG